MDWLSHISSDWSSASFNNMAIHSTAPEPRPSISSPIDSALFATYSSEEAFSPNLAVQPSYDSLNSNSFGIRQACNDQMPRNEHQHITMRDDLSRNNSSPTNPALPCSACNSGCQPWPAEPPSGLPITPGRLERLESLVCKWENCRKPPFQSKGALMRHIDTQHIAPRSFKCPLHSCSRFFSRKDNMEEHVRRVHGVRV